jgi:hypothetical protein
MSTWLRVFVFAGTVGAASCVIIDRDDDDGDPGSGLPCGGFVGATCDDDEFCDLPSDTCGLADEGGTCRARPLVCPAIYQPVRGCDGVMYGNTCEAHAEGVDVQANPR